MSAKMRVLFIEAEGDGVLVALQQLAALFPQPVAGTLELTAAPSEPVIAPLKRYADKSVPLTRAQGRARNDAIVEALRFRPLRVSEIADALCRDKRDVAVTIQRLYPALAKLKAAGKVKKFGNTWAVK